MGASQVARSASQTCRVRALRSHPSKSGCHLRHLEHSITYASSGASKEDGEDEQIPEETKEKEKSHETEVKGTAKGPHLQVPFLDWRPSILETELG